MATFLAASLIFKMGRSIFLETYVDRSVPTPILISAINIDDVSTPVNGSTATRSNRNIIKKVKAMDIEIITAIISAKICEIVSLSLILSIFLHRFESKPPDRFNFKRHIFLKTFSDSAYMHIQSMLAAHCIHPPDFIHKLLLGKNPIRIGEQFVK
ncbi:hypothetical protein D3C71_1713770 [compost metagenome]